MDASSVFWNLLGDMGICDASKCNGCYDHTLEKASASSRSLGQPHTMFGASGLDDSDDEEGEFKGITGR